MFSFLSDILQRIGARFQGVGRSERHPLVEPTSHRTSSNTHADTKPDAAVEVIERDRLLAKRAAEAAGRGRSQK